MSTPNITLRTVDSAGNLDQFLPDFTDLQISPLFCGVGTLQFKYPETGINWNLIHNDLEVAVLLNGVEVKTLRSRVEQTEGDDASEDQGSTTAFIWTYTGRTMLGRLDEAIVYPPLWPKTDPVRKDYVGATPGKIMQDFIQVAQNRGALQWLSWDFTDTHDSAGVAWASTIDLAFYVGTKYTEIVKTLVDAQAAEAQMSARTLQLYNLNTLGVDRTTGQNPVVFVKGRDMKQSPRKASTKELATSVLMAGAANLHQEATADSGTMSQWGRRESYVSLNNVQTAGELDVIGQAIIPTIDRELLEITHDLLFQTDANPQPIRDFDLGDWVYSDVGRGLERHRVKQWVLNVDTGDSSDSFEGSVVLNDLVNEQIEKVHRRLAALENGTSNAGPSETKDDGKPPAVPGNIQLSSASYLQFNVARSVVTANWAAVTTNSDGTAANDIDSYKARWRYSSDATNFWRDTRQVGADETTASFDNIDPGATVIVQVQAWDTWGHAGNWSGNVQITTAKDQTAPNKPSSPTMVSVVGTLRVTWDGLDYQGQQMVADFAGVEVHIGTDGAFTPSSSTKKDYLTAAAAASTTISANQGLTYGTTYWVKLVAVDTSGNKSAPSDTTSNSTATLTQLVSTEIGTGQVGLGNVSFSDLGNLIDDGTFELAAKRTQRQNSMTGLHLAFDNTTASNGGWSIRSDSWAGATSESLLLQGSLPVKPGERVFGAADYRSTSDVPSPQGGTGSYLTLAIKWQDVNGNYLDNTGVVNNVYYTLADNWSVNTNDNTWHRRVTGSSQVAPTNAVYMELWLITNNRTAGTIWVDSVEVRRQIDTLLIAQAAITTALIADLAVNDAKIASASIGKLTTGTLGADMVVGARIKTSDTGARVEMNSGGVYAWDSSGTQTVAISGSDGSVNLIGSLKSGSSGRRIEINPFGTGLPEIRFYPNTGTNYGFLNAVSSGDGTKVFVGLNSGQVTLNSINSEWRVYLTDVAATMALVATSNQSTNGPQLYMGDTQANLTWVNNADGTDRGHLYTNSTGAQVGYNDPSDANDNWWKFTNTGVMRAYGKFDNFPYADHNMALFTGDYSFSNGAACSISYGPTMITTLSPIVVPYTSTQVSTVVTSRSTTGFTASFSSTISGSIMFWCFSR